MDQHALQALTDDGLCAAVPGVTPGQARVLLSSVHRGRPLAARPGLSRAALDRVMSRAHVPGLEVIDERASSRDAFRKYLLATADGHRIECVRIPLERPGRLSVCVSSQVGCALACRFCATGRLGLLRNLEAWEIVEQVRIVRRGLPGDQRIHGVVFQGMGEPLANLDRVVAAIDVLTAPYAQAIDARAITVSTAGLAPGIRRLAREAPRVRLALSLGSARQEIRERIIPIARAHPLDELIEAGVEHARATGLAPLWAITLLAGVNDTPADARAMATLAAAFASRAGFPPEVSIIAYNSIGSGGDDPFAPSGPDVTAAFRTELSAGGLRSHRRYSGGSDIDAGCGQLAARRPGAPG
ncbi:MAG TPA: 23S rRNA (adenine(2503)-C(2))-methyltransferase RlmN [Kofleriaceae bacterium]|nr:23S rRNA (adenine(2503)-C(2))-methyltransferase RlmN [Kofleriaceae bacterium]